jgi:hypothetical protein
MRLALLLAALMVPSQLYAADGDVIQKIAPAPGGGQREVLVKLCDSKTSASSACGPVDAYTAGRQQAGEPHLAVPTQAKVILTADTTCSASPVATIFGSDTVATACTGSTDGCFEIETLPATSGETALVLAYSGWRYYSATLASMTACTDYDVHLILTYAQE